MSTEREHGMPSLLMKFGLKDKIKKSINKKIRDNNLKEAKSDEVKPRDMPSPPQTGAFYDDNGISLSGSDHSSEKQAFIDNLARTLSQEAVEEAQCMDVSSLVEIIQGIKIPLELLSLVVNGLVKIFK